MEETTDVKRKMTPSVPANYVSILQLRERWIKDKEQNRKEQEVEEERRRNQHAEEQQTIQDDRKKPLENLDEMRLNQSDQKHWGMNSKKDESNGGEASWAEEKEETAAIRSERGEGEGLPEKKKKRRRHRKRYDSKKNKRTNQEVDECGSIKPPEIHTPVKDQIQVYRMKEEKEKAMENKSIEKAVTATERQLKDLSIQRGQETKKLKAQTRHDLPLGRVRMPIETATMVWVKKGNNENAYDGNRSGEKPLHA